MSRCVGMIPARYGSKRFPGKPLAKIQGKSLIQRAYENATSCSHLDEVIVVTDDQRIFEHVESFGGRAMMSSPHHATGSDRLAEAAEKIDASIVVNLQGDWPCLESHVIGAVIEILGENGVMGSAVTPLKDPALIQSSSVVKATMDREGKALYFSRSPIPFGMPKVVFGHLGIYSYTREFLLTFAKLPPTPLQLAESLEQLKALEHGYPIHLAVVESAPVSVDRPEDIKRVEEILCSISS